MIDAVVIPQCGEVRPQENLSGADCSNQVSQTLAATGQRIEVKLLQILAGKFFERFAKLRKSCQARIRPAAVGWQVAAGVGRTELDLGKTVQGSILD